MTATAFLLPEQNQPTTRVGRRLYRKQILPKASISYKGRRLDFTDDYLGRLIDAFKDGAFDQVGFQLADAANTHTLDPERFRGEVKGLELTADGLDAIFELTGDGAKLVDDNPGLGVSARIVEDMARADGRRYPVALQHVLGTTDPRVTGMRPWEAVQLAADDTQVVDLTAADYNKGGRMAEITEEEVAEFRAFLAKQKEDAATAATADAAANAELSDEEAQAILDALAADEATQADKDKELAAAGTELSEEARKAIELAKATADQQAIELAGVRKELDTARFERERDAFLAAGVPPKMVELAQPLLFGTGHVIDLSNGQSADAGAVVRSILEEARGSIDLSGEHGGSYPIAGVDTEADGLLKELAALTGEEA